MDEHKTDASLQAPQEANTDKHIDFTEAEENTTTVDADDKKTFKEDDSPTRKEWEELRKEFKEDDSLKENT